MGGKAPVDMAGRGLRSAAELARNRPHGDRLRYVGGCRCDECRRANTRYEQARAAARKNGDWNGIVSAAAARKRLLWLSSVGVGRRAVQAATDIGGTILSEIRSGKRKRIRARTERLILGVTTRCASDHAVRSAGRALSALHDLIEAEGYSERFIAQRLGYANPYLQFGERMTVRNIDRVERLHKELTE